MTLFLLSGGVERDPAVEAWFANGDPLRRMVEPWFGRLKVCGPEVRELIHDGHPTAGFGDAAFGCVAAFSGHAAVGFLNGAGLPDPEGLLDGAGKRMRLVKLRWARPVDEAALEALIAAAGVDIRRRVEAER